MEPLIIYETPPAKSNRFFKFGIVETFAVRFGLKCQIVEVDQVEPTTNDITETLADFIARTKERAREKSEVAILICATFGTVTYAKGDSHEEGSFCIATTYSTGRLIDFFCEPFDGQDERVHEVVSLVSATLQKRYPVLAGSRAERERSRRFTEAIMDGMETGAETSAGARPAWIL